MNAPLVWFSGVSYRAMGDQVRFPARPLGRVKEARDGGLSCSHISHQFGSSGGVAGRHLKVPATSYLQFSKPPSHQLPYMSTKTYHIFIGSSVIFATRMQLSQRPTIRCTKTPRILPSCILPRHIETSAAILDSCILALAYRGEA